MTICCALAVDDGVWIASDRRRCWGNDYLDTDESKWVRKGTMWIGCSGGGRSDEILEGLAVQDTPLGFCNALRQAYIDNKMPEGKPGEWDSTFIVVHAGSIYLIDSGFSLTKWPQGRLLPIGSGRDIAYGVAWALRGGDTKRDIMRLCIEAAISNDCACGGEPWVEFVGGEK